MQTFFRPLLLIATLTQPLFAVEGARVRPADAMGLLKTHCVGCHNHEKAKGGLSLESEAEMLKGGESGSVLTRGKADNSKLITSLSAEGDAHMPPKKQLPEKQMAVLKAWVDAGAQWDSEAMKRFGEMSTEDKLGTLPPGVAPSHALASSADGKWLATGVGNRVLVRETAKPEVVVKTLEGHRDLVQSLAWSADGKLLAAGGFRTVIVWNVSDGKQVHRLSEVLEGRVTGLFFDGASSFIVADGAAGRGGRLHRWKLGQPKPEKTVEAHNDSILVLAASADGKQLATGGADTHVKVWDTATLTEKVRLEGHTGHLQALAFTADGKTLASGAADREIKIWDIAGREMLMQVGDASSVPMALVWSADGGALNYWFEDGSARLVTEMKNREGFRIYEKAGKETKLTSAGGVVQSAVRSGEVHFATRHDGSLVRWDAAKKMTEWPALPVQTKPTISFTKDILPVLSKSGCNLGACHAKASGQAGFKLSVFAFDPKGDFSELVTDSRGRRVFPALPEDSLVLLKATGRVAHEGGQRFEPGSEFAKTIADWIRQGMPYETPGQPALTGIQVEPPEGTYSKRSQTVLKVVAKYVDGTSRDVTTLADYSTSEGAVASVDEHGKVATTSESGEAVIVARYLGHVAVSKIAVPAEKLLPAEKYAGLTVRNEIDKLVYARLQKLGFLPSEPCTDSEFIRRSSLDLIGMLPTVEEARSFLADKSPDKYERWVDALLNRPEWADHWAVKWADLLRPNPSRVGVKPVFLFDQWLRQSLRENKPWDKFVRELLTAQGNTHQYGPVAMWRDKRDPESAAAFIGQIFLGIRLECAKCHHHPTERWDMTDYYQLAAYFTRMQRKGQGISAPISGEPEKWWFSPGKATLAHPVTKASLEPRPPAEESKTLAEDKDPRAALVDWMVAPENPHFARALVNRLWSSFLGRGIVDPVDDFRVSNPPTNGPLLDWLAHEFVRGGYDLKKIMRTMLLSHTYRLSSMPNETNSADLKNYSRSYRRRLPAESLMDAVLRVTESTESFSGLPPGMLAKQTWNHKLESQFMDAFGRPNSSAECPCERDAKPSVVQALHLMNSTKLQSYLAGESGRAARLAKSSLSPEKIVEEIYLACYSRYPEPDELKTALAAFSRPETTRQMVIEDILWSLLNSAEFVFNH
ncbi:MAG: DUF1553 domain-containing protein [Verrucomicrobiaceae bacterium]|nr:DUF1553 domain-containing protein [Verrucomicrobiaceae bacterium]